MPPVKLGIVGCGVISDAYLQGAGRSQLVAVKACTDLVPELAAAQAAAYGIAAVGIEELLADPEIEIVINLTVPLAHAEVSLRAIEAGKHVYSEKPIATTLRRGPRADRGRARQGRAARLGARHLPRRRPPGGPPGDRCRPDRPGGRGRACFATHGMETWHPNPLFFYKRGGGPMLDIGPYPVTQLVNLLGPVESVAAHTSRGFATRTVTSEPRRGEVIEVEVPTTVNGALGFANGANVAITVGWDVWKHAREPIELYGSEGTLLNPDPNFFGGRPRLSEQNGDWQDLADRRRIRSASPNRETKSGAMVADYRIARRARHGAGDQARAGRTGRTAIWRCTCSRCWRRSSAPRSRAGGSGSRPSASGRQPLPLGRDEAVFVTARRRAESSWSAAGASQPSTRSSSSPAGAPVPGRGGGVGGATSAGRARRRRRARRGPRPWSRTPPAAGCPATGSRRARRRSAPPRSWPRPGAPSPSSKRSGQRPRPAARRQQGRQGVGPPAVADDRGQLARGQPRPPVEAGAVGQDGAPPVDLGHQTGEVADQRARRGVGAIDPVEPLRGRRGRSSRPSCCCCRAACRGPAGATARSRGPRSGSRRAAPRRARGGPSTMSSASASRRKTWPACSPGSLTGSSLACRRRPRSATRQTTVPPRRLSSSTPPGGSCVGRGRLEARLVERRQGDGLDRVAVAAPGDAHAIERHRQRADAGIVGRLRRLVGRDLRPARQGRVVDQEAAVDLADAGWSTGARRARADRRRRAPDRRRPRGSDRPRARRRGSGRRRAARCGSGTPGRARRARRSRSRAWWSRPGSAARPG